MEEKEINWQAIDWQTEWEAWACPECNFENIDSRDVTVSPLCGSCNKHFSWDEIERSEDDE